MDLSLQNVSGQMAPFNVGCVLYDAPWWLKRRRGSEMNED